ncbi:hypothetical protein [Anaeromyxobacter oryzisoli]|jgi:hypothetical protein|uniref:hypothetical protein n=1 Tax=Anaeromyxobacter oryzisoli TaxID=2925408 RepID=UPI001F56544D|nr:hypothetical protein [Anaeromyxobacter sp. SG63]
MAARGRLAWAALGFGLAAAFACWNPLAAPFGLVVGLASGIVSVRALRAGAHRPVAAAGLALALVAVGVSAVVLARTAGLGREPGGAPIVTGPSPGEGAQKLDAAAERTRAARERARKELGGIEAPPGDQREGARRP